MNCFATNAENEREIRRRRKRANYVIALQPDHWPTTDEIESLCNAYPINGMLAPDMSLLNWQNGEDIAGMLPDQAVAFYSPLADVRPGDRWRQTDAGEWTREPVPRRVRASAKVHALSLVPPKPAAQPASIEEPAPRVETRAVPESAFVPLGRRHVFLDGDGCWRCMNGDVVEATGKGDYKKLVAMDTSQWFGLVGGAALT